MAAGNSPSPLTTPPHQCRCPFSTVTGGPATASRGPRRVPALISSRTPTVTNSRSPQSRTVVTPPRRHSRACVAARSERSTSDTVSAARRTSTWRRLVAEHEMHVGVDEARDQRLLRTVLVDRAGGSAGSDGGDPPVDDRHRGVVEHSPDPVTTAPKRNVVRDASPIAVHPGEVAAQDERRFVGRTATGGSDRSRPSTRRSRDRRRTAASRCPTARARRRIGR